MNPVIGDKALEAAGWVSADDAMEVDKIRCHVSFALKELKKKHSHSKSNRRSDLLMKLESYVEAGIFPRNENTNDPDQRYPCFVDSLGTPCAVAHLMRESGGATLAETIGNHHKYDSISQIAENENLLPDIQSWVTANGLELSELALIQPTYAFVARNMFDGIELKLSTMAESSTSATTSDIQSLSRSMVLFGDQVRSRRYGAQRSDDILEYLKALDELAAKTPAGNTVVHALPVLLRKEVEGADRGMKCTEPGDYKDLLSEEDLANWKQSNTGNRRLSQYLPSSK